jgi:hypothetical protein
MEAGSSSRIAGHKAGHARKLKKEKGAAAASTAQDATSQARAKAATQGRVGDPSVRAHLEKGIVELLALHELLLSNDVDPDVLADFRAALNRVRTAAWAAEQYVIRKEIDQDSTSVLSFLAGERIRTAYQLCQALADDLRKTGVEFQRGSLVELYEVAKNLTEQLKDIIEKP